MGLRLDLEEAGTAEAQALPLSSAVMELSTSTRAEPPRGLWASALPPGGTRHFGGGWPYCPGDSSATKALLKPLHPRNKTGTRTFTREQGRLCVATAVEILAAAAETATPPLTYSGNNHVPLSVNLSLPLSSLTKGCRVWRGVGSVGLGAVVRRGVVAGSSEQVSDVVEIKGVCSLLRQGLLLAWWLMTVPVLSIRSDPQRSPSGK